MVNIDMYYKYEHNYVDTSPEHRVLMSRKKMMQGREDRRYNKLLGNSNSKRQNTAGLHDKQI